MAMAPLPPRNRSYLNIANAIFFFGLALLLNVYVTLTVHSSSLMVHTQDTLDPKNLEEEYAADLDQVDLDPKNLEEEYAADLDQVDLSYIDDLDGATNNVIHSSPSQSRNAPHDNAYFANDYDNTGITTSASPSLAVVSACIPGERFSTEYINMSHNNKLHYCKRYHAKCILPIKRVNNQSDLHTKWDKLYHINRTMHTEQVDWVLWMDCDTAFTNFEINWYTHLGKHLNTSQLMVVAKDDAGINLGVFLVPNTQLSRKFIQKMYQLRFQLDKIFFHKDQSALKHLIKKNPEIESRIEIVDRKTMNTYLDNDAGEAWVPYHWIMHQVFCNDLVGCTANFTRVMKMVTPQYFPHVDEEVEHEEQPNSDDTRFFSFVSNWWSKLMN